jgi:drug/metabolite transporter (DMT)-like permease
VVPDSLFVRLIDADALTVAFWRLLIAGGGTAVWLLLRRGLRPFADVLRTGWPAWVYMVGVGASGLLFVLAVSLTSVANVVFIIASLPVFAGLFSWLLLGEVIGPRLLRAMVAVAVGLAVIAYGSGETENASLAGDLLALSVSALFALALTAARRAKAVSMVPAVAMGYVLAALAVLPFAAPLSVPAEHIPLVLAHGTFILFSSILLALGPRYITSAEVGLLVLLESVLAPLLAWAVVGENPGIYALIGGAIVVGALAVLNLRRLSAPR